MIRSDHLDRLLARREPWDFVVIGGGATGVGIALDAAARGYAVALVEQHDFGKGTSSRSTKLVHGGVRYLQQGRVSLVREALRERGYLRQNAPHLVHDLRFVVPAYRWWEKAYFAVGLKTYDLLAGRLGFGATRIVSREALLGEMPTLRAEGLRGGVAYHDGQFDDARLLIQLAMTAAERGATLVNYCRVVGLLRAAGGRVEGVVARDEESGREFDVRGKVVVSATGAYCDGVRNLGDPAAQPLVSPSQGVHLVFPRSMLPSSAALMIPRTRDGRVMFAIPWHGHTLVGTTDVPVASPEIEPRATEEEIDAILETAAGYLERAPKREDVLSVFAGVRPLVKAAGKTNTAALSRDHSIHVEESGLVTITGGKWTTYRNMAEDCVNQAAARAGLAARPCGTRELPIHGHCDDAARVGELAVYGSDAPRIEDLIKGDSSLGEVLHPALPYRAAEVVWAARYEMARTVEDVLARRLRALFLNAAAAREMAPPVATLLAAELGRDAAWREEQVRLFDAVARGYCVAKIEAAR